MTDILRTLLIVSVGIFLFTIGLIVLSIPIEDGVYNSTMDCFHVCNNAGYNISHWNGGELYGDCRCYYNNGSISREGFTVL